jgi:selT/selW/selH-like putative selenoprotein
MSYKITIAVLLFMILFAGIYADTTSANDSSAKKENLVIEIHHCTTCGFMNKADRLAKEIQEEYEIEAKLIVGEIGSFDVFLNDELIFSKAREGRFPEPGEISRLINEHLEK